jgi:hypothetical protein
MSKVSIIIPCYNQGHFLHEAIKSALDQTHQEVEVVVVNDGSTDQTARVIQHFEQRKSSGHAEFVSITQENRGLSAARNAGISKSSGEFIVCLDADDRLSPAYIEKTVKFLEDYDIVGTGTQEFGNKFRRWKTPLVEVRYKELLIKNRLNYASIYKKKLWTDVGGYDEGMKIGFEDFMFWLDCSLSGAKIMVLNEFLFYYRKHEKSMFSDALQRRAEIIKYMNAKHPMTT